MQLSVYSQWPGYRAWKRMPRRVRSAIRIYVDGVLTQGVIALDTKRGYVLMLAADDDGQPGRVNARRDRFVMQQLRGRVHVEFV